MLQTIDEILALFEQHPAAVRVIIITVFMILVAGGAIAYRIRGAKVRQAMSEWDSLFSDLNMRVAALYRELMDVREELQETKSELAESIAAAKRAQEISIEQRKEIARLKDRVQQLLSKEQALKKELETVQQQQMEQEEEE